MKQMPIKRGDIFWVNFDPARATEVQKVRPALVCSHDIINEHSNRVIVAPITSNLKKVYPFEYILKNHPVITGKVMFDQMRSLDKSRLGKQEMAVPFKEFHEIDLILKFFMGIQ